jgi:DNA-binding NarL/FixJ family response regulator
MAHPKSLPAPAPRKRVIVVDDHPMFRHGLAQILAREPGLELSAQASNFAEALELARACKPDVALIDIMMPGVNGIELIKTLLAEFPGLRILMLSMHEESIYAQRAVRAGALGFLGKDASYEDLVEAIHRVAEGRLYLSSELTEKLLTFAIQDLDIDSDPNLETLSARELEVLRLYGEGLDTNEILTRFNIGMKTIETYRTRLKAKLGLADFPDLLRFAKNWVERDTIGPADEKKIGDDRLNPV